MSKYEIPEYEKDVADKIRRIEIDGKVYVPEKETREQERQRIVEGIISLADELESECNKDGNKGTKQWMTFKRFRNTLFEKEIREEERQRIVEWAKKNSEPYYFAPYPTDSKEVYCIREDDLITYLTTKHHE